MSQKKYLKIICLVFITITKRRKIELFGILIRRRIIQTHKRRRRNSRKEAEKE